MFRINSSEDTTLNRHPRFILLPSRSFASSRPSREICNLDNFTRSSRRCEVARSVFKMESRRPFAKVPIMNAPPLVTPHLTRVLAFLLWRPKISLTPCQALGDGFGMFRTTVAGIPVTRNIATAPSTPKPHCPACPPATSSSAPAALRRAFERADPVRQSSQWECPD